MYAIRLNILNTPKHTGEVFLSCLARKEENAFKELYDDYSPALYGIALRISRDEEAANDVLQDAFVKVWKNIEKFDSSKANLYTWMLNITRNTAIDRLRSAKVKYEVQPTENQAIYIEKNNSTSISEDELLVKELVEKLKPEHKLMINMAYFGGFTQEEISKKLEIPLGTVKTRARAALRELRKFFN